MMYFFEWISDALGLGTRWIRFTTAFSPRVSIGSTFFSGSCLLWYNKATFGGFGASRRLFEVLDMQL